jgi:hypothetical protein
MPNSTKTYPSSLHLSPWRVYGGYGGPVILLFGVLSSVQAAPLTKEEQILVDRAIESGVAFLKRSQASNGTWAGPKEKHQLGYAVLPGLALLECGVPANSPAVRRVALLVRRASSNLVGTYELALCILFLDRLGDPKDGELIQTMAARLIAGQSDTGGWTYVCPPVTRKTRDEMFALLRKLDPPAAMEALARAGRDPLAEMPARPKVSDSPSEDIRSTKPPFQGTTTGKLPSTPKGGVLELPDPLDTKKPSPPPEKSVKPDEKQKPLVVPRHLKNLPVFRKDLELPRRVPRGKGDVPTATDNSNTQFAILGLCVAQRHDVPARRTMQLMVRRFASSQNQDGTWSYRYRSGGREEGEPAMTCVGLLGLAVGGGIARQPNDSGAVRPAADPRIVNGLAALRKQVGKPTGTWKNLPMENLYYLWSLERVGVLYGLPVIGDRDWYRWGAEILVANQQQRGFWISTEYPGSSPTIDTCMALLFLKRANFTADLSKRLNIKPEELNATIIRTKASQSPGESMNNEKP